MTGNRGTDTYIRRKIFHVHMDDFYCKLSLEMDSVEKIQSLKIENKKVVSFILCIDQTPLMSFKTYLKVIVMAVYEITTGHRSLCGTISCVTDRIHFLPVTKTGRFSNFNSMQRLK